MSCRAHSSYSVLPLRYGKAVGFFHPCLTIQMIAGIEIHEFRYLEAISEIFLYWRTEIA